MAPEYAFNGRFSTKSDIFSFGVMVLEIVSGKKSRAFQNEGHDHTLISHVSHKLHFIIWINRLKYNASFRCTKELPPSTGVGSMVKTMVFLIHQIATNDTLVFHYLSRHGYCSKKEGHLN